MATRTKVQPQPGSLVEFLLYLGLGFGVGGLVYVGLKSVSAKGSSPTPGAPIGGGLTSSLTRLLGGSGGASGTRVIATLQSNPAARKVFFFQAALYSYGLSNNLPDGVLGPNTQKLVLLLNRATNSGESTAFNDDSLSNLWTAIENLSNNSPQAPRSLPFTMPQALVQQINSEALAIAPDAPTLQVNTT